MRLKGKNDHEGVLILKKGFLSLFLWSTLWTWLRVRVQWHLRLRRSLCHLYKVPKFLLGGLNQYFSTFLMLRLLNTVPFLGAASQQWKASRLPSAWQSFRAGEHFLTMLLYHNHFGTHQAGNIYLCFFDLTVQLNCLLNCYHIAGWTSNYIIIPSILGHWNDSQFMQL